MKTSEYFKKSFINAIGVFIYVLAVSTLLANAKNIFSDQAELLAPVFMLLLFIISATITGALVLGRPMYLYLGGMKREAFVLLFYTIAWLVFFLVAVAAVMMAL